MDSSYFSKESNDSPEYFVGVGASAGGLSAIEAFFRSFPLDSDISFAIIQHLSPDFNSLMDEILSRHTRLKILRAEDRMVLKKNCIYLIPPAKNMIVSNKKLLISDRGNRSSSNLNLPINLFFRTLAQDFGKKSIAVLLSGSGSDGSRGVVDIAEAGGLVIAQTEESSKFASMPSSAVATGSVDKILDPKHMVEHILSHVGYLSPVDTKHALDEALLVKKNFEKPILAIFDQLNTSYGVDFNYYRPTTIDRRLDRRMGLCDCLSVQEYSEYLKGKPKELDALYHDLLIGVTQFFRDAAAFEKFEAEVIPGLLDRDSKERQTVRVWTPGCASGEEAYSLAILFDEFVQKYQLDAEIKIFATDLHKGSLTFASAGTFPIESLKMMSKDRLEKYFVCRSDSHFTVNRSLRKMIVFAPHNVLVDPPFTNLDLVVCRNLCLVSKICG